MCIVYGENLLLNQRVGKIVPKDITFKNFIYSLFRSDNFKRQLELLSNGVAQQNLSPVQTLDLKIILPPKTLIAQYENHQNLCNRTCAVSISRVAAFYACYMFC